MQNLRKIILSLFLCLFASTVDAQESLGAYQIRVTPDRDDWMYQLNQTAKFDVAVTLNNRLKINKIDLCSKN